VQERLRASRVGTDLVGRRYLDLVDTGTATAGQLNEFGIWLSGQGILEPAEEYFRAALELNQEDAEVWNNLGMVQLRLGQDGAKSSFQHAIELVPTHAVAHYNMGIFLDHAGEYDAAVEEYIRALTLDPRLGDPVHNPQVVHNQRLLVVRLGLYERKARTLGLPMGQVAPKK
jgi:Flp pilus assembly protein TadD